MSSRLIIKRSLWLRTVAIHAGSLAAALLCLTALGAKSAEAPYIPEPYNHNGIRVTFSTPPGAPNAAQRAKAIEQLDYVRATVETVLNTPAESRCAVLREQFTVKRLSERCHVTTVRKPRKLKAVEVTVDSSDELDVDTALYMFDLMYDESAKTRAKQGHISVYRLLPNKRLSIQTPSDMPTLGN